MDFNSRYSFNHGCDNKNYYQNSYSLNNGYNNQYSNYQEYNCCPSYYKEEKRDNYERKCWEGTFKVYEPICREEKRQERHYCRPCCLSLCNLFRNCCRW